MCEKPRRRPVALVSAEHACAGRAACLRHYHVERSWPGHDGNVDVLDEPSRCTGNLPRQRLLASKVLTGTRFRVAQRHLRESHLQGLLRTVVEERGAIAVAATGFWLTPPPKSRW